MASYAIIDWKDNMEILDENSATYYPIIYQGRSEEDINKMKEENYGCKDESSI